MSDMPNRIRELRLARDWSQDELGDRAGCSKMQISDLERGNVQLTVEWMRRLGHVLGVSPGELLSLEDNPLLPIGQEREIIERYREASPGERDSINRVTEALVHTKPARDAEAA